MNQQNSQQPQQNWQQNWSNAQYKQENVNRHQFFKEQNQQPPNPVAQQPLGNQGFQGQQNVQKQSLANFPQPQAQANTWQTPGAQQQNFSQNPQWPQKAPAALNSWQNPQSSWSQQNPQNPQKPQNPTSNQVWTQAQNQPSSWTQPTQQQLKFSSQANHFQNQPPPQQNWANTQVQQQKGNQQMVKSVGNFNQLQPQQPVYDSFRTDQPRNMSDSQQASSQGSMWGSQTQQKQPAPEQVAQEKELTQQEANQEYLENQTEELLAKFQKSRAAKMFSQFANSSNVEQQIGPIPTQGKLIHCLGCRNLQYTRKEFVSKGREIEKFLCKMCGMISCSICTCTLGYGDQLFEHNPIECDDNCSLLIAGALQGDIIFAGFDT